MVTNSRLCKAAVILEPILYSLSNYYYLQKKLGASIVSTLLYLAEPRIRQLIYIVARRAVSANQIGAHGRYFTPRITDSHSPNDGGRTTNLLRILPHHLCVMTDIGFYYVTSTSESTWNITLFSHPAPD